MIEDEEHANQPKQHPHTLIKTRRRHVEGQLIPTQDHVRLIWGF